MVYATRGLRPGLVWYGPFGPSETPTGGAFPGSWYGAGHSALRKHQRAAHSPQLIWEGHSASLKRQRRIPYQARGASPGTSKLRILRAESPTHFCCCRASGIGTREDVSGGKTLAAKSNGREERGRHIRRRRSPRRASVLHFFPCFGSTFSASSECVVPSPLSAMRMSDRLPSMSGGPAARPSQLVRPTALR